jgi:hypothetical protein
MDKKQTLMGLTVHYSPVAHIKWADVEKALSPSEWEDFKHWMRGQTCIKDGVYLWDFQRWLEQGRKRDQGPDWD